MLFFIFNFTTSTVTLHAEIFTYKNKTYHDCEGRFKWIKNNTINVGSSAVVYEACLSRDCNYVAKTQSNLEYHTIETSILTRLKDTGIAPTMFESFSCHVNEKSSLPKDLNVDEKPSLTKNFHVIVMEKFDGTVEQLLQQHFDKYLIKKFFTKGKILDYFYKVHFEQKDNQISYDNIKKLLSVTNNFHILNSFSLLGHLVYGFPAVPEKHLKMYPMTDTAQEIVKSIHDVLTTLSSNGIIHRDIKPDNMLYKKLKKGFKIVVTDFATARDVLNNKGLTSPLTYWKDRFQDAPNIAQGIDLKCYDITRMNLLMDAEFGIPYSEPKECAQYSLPNAFKDVIIRPQ